MSPEEELILVQLQNMRLRQIIDGLRRETMDYQRVVALLLDALGGSYTASHKQLTEMDLYPEIFRQDNNDLTVTFAVRKEEKTWRP